MRSQVAYLSEFLKNPKGSMTVEFVAFAPVLIAAMVVSFEFGRAFWAYDVITRDVRGAVRYLTRDSTAQPPYAGNVCPQAARYIAQTGSPTDGAEGSKHFPWKGVTPTFQCLSVAFTGANYNDAGHVVTMTATVPVTLTLQAVINRFLNMGGTASLPLTYPLTVSYQARYAGN